MFFVRVQWFREGDEWIVVKRDEVTIPECIRCASESVSKGDSGTASRAGRCGILEIVDLEIAPKEVDED